MKSVKNWLVNNIPWLVPLGTILLCVLLVILGTKAEDGSYTFNGKPAEISEATQEWMEEAKKAQIEYAKKAVPALLADGTYVNVPTVDSIDDNNPIENTETSIEGGRGSYIWAPTDTFDVFKDYTIGKCWDVDGSFNEQCWDLAAVFWMNYTDDGRLPSTCQTGAARGMWDCRGYNAGDEFDLVYDKTDIQTGDWIITSAGTYGHVCEAAGPYNNGYVACLGQNQGGTRCPGSTMGAATNIINLGLGSFLGAFRPKTYEKPEPSPTPTPSGDVAYTYVKGDYFSKVLVNLGLDEGNLWGANGTVRYYTKQLVEQGVLDRNGNVFIGVPFTLTRR